MAKTKSKKSAVKKSAAKKSTENVVSSVAVAKVDVFSNVFERASKSIEKNRAKWEEATGTKKLSDEQLITVVCEKVRYGKLPVSILS